MAKRKKKQKKNRDVARKKAERRKRPLTAAERADRRRRKEMYETVFINGKQVRVKRPEKIEGMDVDEFIEANADPIWLHQNEMWELIKNED